MSTLDNDEPGFWPGYVAAVSGLVQGLLIMAMALASAIFALGQLARVAPADKAPQPATAASRERVGAVIVPPVPLSPPVTVGEEGPAALPPVQPATGTRISAGFGSDAVILPQSAVPALLASLAEARSAGVRRWRISIPADISDPRQQRAAYLRLLGLRALFVQQGIGAADVDLWINSTAGTDGAASGVATIEPLDTAEAVPFDRGPAR